MPRKTVSEKPIVVSTGGAAAVPARRKSSTKRTARTIEAPEMVEVVTAAIQAEPSQEEIARLAYFYWEARGCAGGSPEEDWVRAEQELRSAR